MTGRWAGAAAALFLGWSLLRHPVEKRILRHASAPVPDVSSDPIQQPAEQPPFEVSARGKRFRIVPRYAWDESALVVAEDRYRWGEAAALIPEDYAMAWGPVAAPPYRGRIHFRQANRWYFFSYRGPGLDRGVIVSHSANTHVIPATSRLAEAASLVSGGDRVRLEGWLVDVAGIDDPGFQWRTSTSRTDEGPGSCETVYVTRLTIDTRVYE
ncbi:MAG TPA: hypothetical protein VKH46_03130 [Thermoanaerobaculia bacterium]|jgi:hypothetical protein|nr:hypothetical protein [Thermoanaerobaculia bacterium]